MGMSKHIRECRSICVKEGFSQIMIHHGGKHLAIETEFGRMTAPCTPSGQRWRHNLRASARRMVLAGT